jgi:dipeptidyl-peptidase 4
LNGALMVQCSKLWDGRRADGSGKSWRRDGRSDAAASDRSLLRETGLRNPFRRNRRSRCARRSDKWRWHLLNASPAIRMRRIAHPESRNCETRGPRASPGSRARSVPAPVTPRFRAGYFGRRPASRAFGASAPRRNPNTSEPRNRGTPEPRNPGTAEPRNLGPILPPFRFAATIWRMFKSSRLALLFVAFLAFSAASAERRPLTLEDIYHPDQRIEFSGARLNVIRWLNDGRHYLQRGSGGDRLLKVEADSGESEPFFDADALTQAFSELPGFTLESAREVVSRGRLEVSSQEDGILIATSRNLFYFDLGEGRLQTLTRTEEPESEASLSPDGRRAAFVRGNDLYVVDTASGEERRLTIDGSEDRLNGILDWVYQEELYGRGNFRGYWWSPDGRSLAFLQLTQESVPRFTVVDHMPLHLELETTPYPKAGDPNPEVRLGRASVGDGEVQWIDLSAYEGESILIVRVGWTPQGLLYFQVQDREQTWLDLLVCDDPNGSPRKLFRETSPAWVARGDDPVWLSDGGFLLLSERSGWNHLYRFNADGGLIGNLTSGEWEIRSLHGVDAAEEWAYLTGTLDGVADEMVYRVRLNGGEVQRLTERPGTHRPRFSPDFSRFLNTWSDLLTPPQVRLKRSDGSLVRMVQENRVEALDEFQWGSVERMQVNTRDGFPMEAILIRPPDFDPERRRPVVVHVYGGPSAPRTRNAWQGANYLWHQFLAQQGYLVWILDNRSASGKGIRSAWPIHRNLGALEAQDLEDGVQWLRAQPYVDPDRIGLWGWSYGGYLTAYAMTRSKSFKIGIAGAPVTDWRLYDTIYTERYMGTPQNNPDGYRDSSVIEAAERLHGRLLLIHGTLDDNVHLQNTLKLAYALQKAGKDFELMLYPRSRHSVSDPNQSYHMRRMMFRFIQEGL